MFNTSKNSKKKSKKNFKKNSKKISKIFKKNLNFFVGKHVLDNLDHFWGEIFFEKKNFRFFLKKSPKTSSNLLAVREKVVCYGLIYILIFVWTLCDVQKLRYKFLVIFAIFRNGRGQKRAFPHEFGGRLFFGVSMDPNKHPDEEIRLYPNIST